MQIVLEVARNALAFSIAKCGRGMALVAGQIRMPSQERKGNEVVVE